MSKRAAEYQAKVTGRPSNWGCKLNRVRFDGYKDGKLLEVKVRHEPFINKEKNVFHKFFKKTKGDEKLIKQAFIPSYISITPKK